MAENLRIFGATLDVQELEALRENSLWLTLLGVLWVVLGIVAMALPFVATLAVELLFGALLSIGGIVQIAQALSGGWRSFAFHLLTGIAALVTGALLLLFPLPGILTLTLLLGAFFLADGLIRVVWALTHRSLPGWGWSLTSGLLGILVGVLIWLGWPSTAIWVIGVLAGIELIFAGAATIAVAQGARARASRSEVES